MLVLGIEFTMPVDNKPPSPGKQEAGVQLEGTGDVYDEAPDKNT